MVRKPTTSLAAFINKEPPPIEDAQRWILCGANICFRPQSQDMPILHYWVWKGNLDLVNVCFQSPNSIDFTATSVATSSTPLHFVFYDSDGVKRKSRDDIMKLISAIVNRLNTHPTDQVDWDKKNKWMVDFMNLAASNYMLSCVYSAVRTYYEPKKHQISLLMKPQLDDWNALSPEDRLAFTLPSDIEDSTHRLLILVVEQVRDSTEVEKLVTSGADICYNPSSIPMPILHYWIWLGEVELVEGCFKSPHPIDFTIVDEKTLSPPLHFLFYDWDSHPNAVDHAILVMNAFRARFEANSKDTINWTQRNRCGYDLFSLSASKSCLSSIWNIVKFLSPLRADQPLKLIQQPCRVDWNQLSDDDKKFFVVPS